MSRDSAPVIELCGIVTRFGSQLVHDGSDLTVRRGEVLGLVGGSGSGKTTLLRQMIGLQRPSAGRVIAFGEPLFDLRGSAAARLRQRWGVLFQYGALFTALTVAENVALPLRELRRLDEAMIRELVRLKLAMVGLKPEDGLRYPAELSGGMVKRVGLARALVMKPQILLYDEPTTGLDPVSTKNVDDMIRDVSREHGVTSVIISHDMASTFRIGDRISALYGGVIIESGAPEEIRQSRHKWLREFIETSGAVQMVPCDAKDLIVDEVT